MQYQIFNTLSGALLKKEISKNSKSVDFMGALALHSLQKMATVFHQNPVTVTKNENRKNAIFR